MNLYLLRWEDRTHYIEQFVLYFTAFSHMICGPLFSLLPWAWQLLGAAYLDPRGPIEPLGPILNFSPNMHQSFLSTSFYSY